MRPLAPDTSIFELITGVYLALRSDRVLVFSETYNVLHRAMGTSWQVTDGFFLAGYRIGKFIPFGQIEARRGDGAADPFYNPAAAVNSATPPPVDYIEGIAGLHFDLNTWSAITLALSGCSRCRIYYRPPELPRHQQPCESTMLLSRLLSRARVMRFGVPLTRRRHMVLTEVRERPQPSFRRLRSP